MDIQQYSSRREAETGTGTDWFVGLGGFGVSLLIAGVLEGPRATIGSTNVALFLAVVVVAAGVLGRRAGGWITALGAALSFNFFHTRPVHTLRIASGRDVITVVLLAALGGNCHSAVAVLTRTEGAQLHLTAALFSPDGTERVEGETRVAPGDLAAVHAASIKAGRIADDMRVRSERWLQEATEVTKEAVTRDFNDYLALA